MLKSTICAAAVLTLMLAAAAPAAADSGWIAVTNHYEDVRQALVSDSVAGVSEHAVALRLEIEALSRDLTADKAGVPAEALEEVAGLLPEAAAAAQELEAAESLEAARDAFNALTKPLVRWRQAAGSGPVVAYCAMKKRSWLQPAGDPVENPYYGKEMLGCGAIVDGA
jgi:hypothetical protein